MTPLTPMMPSGNPRSIKIVEGGYCSNTRYEEKLQEKGAQHKALEEALKDYAYNVTTLPIIIGQSGSQYHTTSDALAKIGVEHGPANKVMSIVYQLLACNESGLSDVYASGPVCESRFLDAG